MRTIFFGSPEFAVPCLEALHDISEVVAVISQPDKPAGRGLAMRPPAVKARALALGLDVWQPTKVRTAEFAEKLGTLGADVAVVVAYGRILPKAVLDVPRVGCVNVHASLLPRWRGAAPIQWSIVHGDTETGVTLMQMDEGMDTGPILATAETSIERNDDAATLSSRLSKMGAELLRRELPRYVAGELTPEPQNDADATMAPLLDKAHGRIDWNQTARAVHNQIRGMNPWPGAHTALGDRRIKVHRAMPSTLDPEGAAPGEVTALDPEGILVACAEGTLEIQELQESGRKRVDARAFISGRGVAVGDRFSTEGIAT
ncbi:MAG: methionyl-tRNA formyltransferase [Myxococcales bacterium]|nr:MAG: methionyl-tRNA formyltransferase [Myxococcales bacterium]